MQYLKQSTAASTIVGPILDSAGAEYASAVIGDLSYSVNGGTLTALAASATLTYIANGQYTLALNATNTGTIGRLDITCNKPTYQMPPARFEVLQATVFDALVTNAAGGLNGLPLSKANNIVDSNVISVGPTGANTAQTAGDLYAYLTTNLDAAVSTRLATSGYTAPDNTSASSAASSAATAATQATNAASQTTATNIREAVGLAAANLDAQLGAIPTTIRIKKNNAFNGFSFAMFDADGAPATGKTVTATVAIDGAAFTALTNAPAEIGSGGYKVDLAAGDTNGNDLLFLFTAAGCKSLFLKVVTQP